MSGQSLPGSGAPDVRAAKARRQPSRVTYELTPIDPTTTWIGRHTDAGTPIRCRGAGTELPKRPPDSETSHNDSQRPHTDNPLNGKHYGKHIQRL